MRKQIQNSSKMEEVNISHITPQGWLKEYLALQKKGLTGNLDKIGFPYDRISWGATDVDTTAENENPGWWVYEQTAYWIDGMERCSILLQDDELREKVENNFAYVLQNADPDGYLGPKFLKEESHTFGRWPHVVFFRALMAEYSRNGNEKILDAICDHYLGHEWDYGKGRDVLNVEIMLWAYLHSGKQELLELAVKSYQDYNEQCKDDNCVQAMLSDKKAYAHGVTYNEFCKLGAILYICTGDEKYLDPVFKAYEKIDRYQMLPDGLHCCNEFLLDNDYMQTHETCDVVDYTWTLGYLLMATGDGCWADKIERCIFNAGMGSVDDEFKSIQYFSGLNQVIADATSNHGAFFKGREWMSYRPFPGTECCTGNVNRFMPNYCARMWMQKENDIFAVLYGPSVADFDVNGSKVEIQQKTAYPFDETIVFKFVTTEACKFNFHVRIPGWCKHAEILFNGVHLDCEVNNGFATISREFINGDTVMLSLPSEINICDYNGAGCYVEKGPLLYTYSVKTKKTPITNIEKTTEDFPAYDMHPDGPWNYALCTALSDEDMPRFCVTESNKANPWTLDHCPYQIQVKARKVNGWELERADTIQAVYGLYEVPWVMVEEKGDYTFTPRIPDESFIEKHGYGEVENITLVPMGVTQLRMTIFPIVKD